jgi:PTH1 family peptidyl-tRNA hydrolase
MSVHVAIGLGNMGSRYNGTRHNVGMEAVAVIAKSYGAGFVRNKFCAAWLAQADVAGRRIIFAAPEGYMNESGVNIANILRFLKLKIEDAAVFYDDITIESGRFKLSEGGSSGGHNGIENIMAVCGNSFARLRIGLGGKPFKTMALSDYVLGKLGSDESAAFNSMMPNLTLAFESLVKNGMAKAQNEFNGTQNGGGDASLKS